MPDTNMRVITLAGKIYIDRMSEVYNLLINEIKHSKHVLLSFSSIEDFDLSFLQILFAAKKETQKQNIKFNLTGSVKENISTKLLACGYINSHVASGMDLEQRLKFFN